MSDVSISVLSDPNARDSGDAILRLTGVALVPPGSTYRIDPIAYDEAVELPEGWPSGERKPREQRITPDGVDLVIGTDVVAATALQPGTRVTISVPAVGVRADLEWPTLPNCNSPRPESTTEVLTAPAADLAVQAALRLASSSNDERKCLEIAPALAPDASAEEAERRIIAALVRNLSDYGSLSTLSLAPDVPSRPRATPEPARDVALASLKPVSELRPSNPLNGPLPMPAKPVPPKPMATPVALEVVPPPPVPTVRRATPSSGDMADVKAGSRFSRLLLATVSAFLLGLVLAGAAAVVAPIAMPRLALMSAPAALHTELTHRSPANVVGELTDILAVPESSPRGDSADHVGLEDALRRADRSLLGASSDGPDRREAKFWLRKALSSSLGDERLLWAITQLGTLYASPDGEAPDFASARVLWEIAAAKGDPVALCFLASLFESGLGVAKDTSEALSLYQRSKSRGGCRDVDAAIARLAKGAP